MSVARTLGSSSAVERGAVNAVVAGSIPASPAKPSKRLRILTNREFPQGFEAIEWDAKHRQFFWYAEEAAAIACFPCDREFAEEKFAECGRALDVSKLPNWPKPMLPWWQRLWAWVRGEQPQAQGGDQ